MMVSLLISFRFDVRHRGIADLVSVRRLSSTPLTPKQSTELTHDQCRTLLARLSETSYPFQCAHGRPSLAPIVNLANPSSSSTGELATKTWRAGASGGAASRNIDWGRLATSAEQIDVGL